MGAYPFYAAPLPAPSALTAAYFFLGVWTGDMVDRCTGTWLTLFGKQTCREFDHALERERRHELERRV
ncbi:hypothetical protein C6382_21020, partial [Pseudomonas sp. BBP2017]